MISVLLNHASKIVFLYLSRGSGRRVLSSSSNWPLPITVGLSWNTVLDVVVAGISVTVNTGVVAGSNGDGMVGTALGITKGGLGVVLGRRRVVVKGPRVVMKVGLSVVG